MFAMCMKRFNVVKRVHNHLKNKEKQNIHLTLFSTAGEGEGGEGRGRSLFSEIYVNPGSCNL